MKLPKELTTITPLSKYLAMLLFIALPFVGFLLGMRHEQLISSPSIITNYPTPVADETANWKTYTLGNLLTFKYPEESFSIYGDSLDNGIRIVSTNGVSIYIFTYPNIRKLSLDTVTTPLELFIGGAPLYHPKYLDNSIYSKANIKVSETMFGGIKAYQITTPPPQYTEGILNLEIATIKGDKSYHLEIWSFKDGLDTNEKKLVDQILSTFQFLR